MSIKSALESVPLDPRVEARAWDVVRAAFEERQPSAPPVRRARGRVAILVTAAVVAVVAAAAFSSPGRAVVDAVRRTIGIEHASHALFRLPAPGRLLVSGSGGTWVVSEDGSKRRLGAFTQAAWSPHGIFVVASSGDELAALEPGGGAVHWTLARPGVSSARWGGTRADTRIAYLSRGRLRVVAGDGTGDVDVGAALHVAPAWLPERHVVAYARRGGGVVVLDVDSGRRLAVHAARGVRELAWSPDGRTLVAVTARAVLTWGPSGRIAIRIAGVGAAAFAPDGQLALVHGPAVTVVGTEGSQTVFRAPGRLAGVAWSPNGRWLVTTLPAADQLVFVGERGGVRAVANLARQLGGGATLDGWMPGP